ncbi:MAG: outer membrane protein assembly factor BamC [Gammaproteobacteria bacterium]|nr:outer membrane protein assembly factor BamC [Gammaproteobacteria bacterium]MYC25178.1 outer membrane protein assembly factor BamC [Gammaproteobacteria bacterium]
MKNSKIFTVILLLGVLVWNGCSAYDREHIDVTRADDYTNIRSTPELVIPSHMDPIEVEDLWVVPEIEYRPLAPAFTREVPRPRQIVGDADRELVSLQNLGPNRSWMVVQRAAETVWPVIKQWIQDSGIVIRHEDRRKGALFSDRISFEGAETDSPRALIELGKQTADLEGGADWLAVQLENGFRRGSTEVHLRYINEPSDEAVSTTEWPENSTSIDIERAILNNLAQYDASGYVAPTVSIEAANISLKPKAEVVEDEDGFPLLRLYVDFTRAWATIQKSLNNAEIDIHSQESGNRYFEIEVSENVLRSKEKHFFRRLIRFGNEGAKRYPSIVRIHIEGTEDSDEWYTVRLANVEAEEPLPVEFARELLLIVREHLI